MIAILLLAAAPDAAAARAAHTFIAQYDTDRDGKVSASEFPCQADAAGTCDDLSAMLTWEMYDRNGDGFVSAAEYVAVTHLRKARAKPVSTGRK